MNKQLVLDKQLASPPRGIATTVRHRLIAVCALVALLVVGVWRLDAPAMWWDEGWTLSVARNFAERGLYGRLLLGTPAAPGLEAAFSVTGMVALVFRVLGAGVWQGRLVGVLALVGVMTLMYHLVRRLYNRRIAVATLFVLLLLPMHPQLHPVIMARQVLAETPMFCYLLVGYLGLLAALRRPLRFVPLTILVWSVALVTKAQVLPFWIVSLLAPLGAALVFRRWRAATVLGVVLGGAYGATYGLLWAQRLALHNHTLPGTPVQGLYDVTAFVPTALNRWYALRFTLYFGLPTLTALLHGAWQWLRQRQVLAHDDAGLVRLALLGLAGSWFGWYLVLSVGVPRYLFPATFFGSMFVAAWLAALTDDFNVARTIKRATAVLRRVHPQNVGALVAILIVAIALPLTLLGFGQAYAVPDGSAQRVADFLNTRTAPNAVIETYESELHFLLNRRYHYPPDQTHVELNRRSLLQQAATVAYDPLVADPDYLVVGRFTKENELYAPVLSTNAFRLLLTDGNYTVYERVR